MTKPLIFLSFALLMAACHHFLPPESDLIGVWKSDRAKTLTSIYAVDGMPKEVQQVFAADLLGHMIIEFQQDRLRVLMARSEGVEEIVPYMPYRLVKETEAIFTIAYEDAEVGKEVTQTMVREGHCYHVPVPQWEFREYFCKQP